MPNLTQVILPAGQACYISINRTIDGSYGTMAFETNDPYLLIFDEGTTEYTSKDPLGLIEVDNYDGWEPRTVLVANTGLLDSAFIVGFQSAFGLFNSVASLVMLLLI